MISGLKVYRGLDAERSDPGRRLKHPYPCDNLRGHGCSDPVLYFHGRHHLDSRTTPYRGGGMRSSNPLRDSLLEKNEPFRQLFDQHQKLDSRLNELSRQLYRTKAEKLEEVVLKKRKLQLKDQMEIMIRRHGERSENNAVPVLQTHERG